VTGVAPFSIANAAKRSLPLAARVGVSRCLWRMVDWLGDHHSISETV
jgi:hypothetical protein